MIDITITIASDEHGALTDFERGILNSLSGVNIGKTGIASTGVEESSPKTEGKGSPKLQLVEAVLPGDDEDIAPPDASDATMKKAVEAATGLVSQGKAAKVKEALAAAGVKRVSELKGDGIATFLKALDA